MSDQQSENDDNAVTIDNSNADSVLYLPLDEIVEDKEYSTLIPPVSREEYESLKRDIAVNGIRVPLMINSNRVLLDGYTRLRIVRELGLSTVPCIIRDTQDRLEEQILIITVNANRRHMNTAQKAELVLKVLEIRTEMGKRKRMSNLINNKLNGEGEEGKKKEAEKRIDETEEKGKGKEGDVQGKSRAYAIDSFPGKESRIGSEMTSTGHDDSWYAVSREFRVSQRILAKAKRIKSAAMKDRKIAEYWSEALQGKRSVHSVYERVKQKEAREAVRPIMEEGKRALDSVFNNNDAVTPSSTSTVKILRGDFRKVLKDIPDNSIDLIFTDPPYGEEYLYLIKDLAVIARRILKPSGFLAIMYGQDHLDRFFLAMDEAIRGTSSISVTGSVTGTGNGNGTASPEPSSSSLRYYWTAALHMPESHGLLATKNVEVHWKPIIIYQKEPFIRAERRFRDHITEPKPDKDLHVWRQDTGSAIHIIGSLSSEHDTVLDPMAGTGTTIEACLILKRRCIAVESDDELYELLRRRFEGTATADAVDDG